MRRVADSSCSNLGDSLQPPRKSKRNIHEERLEISSAATARRRISQEQIIEVQGLTFAGLISVTIFFPNTLLSSYLFLLARAAIFCSSFR
mmetsp:Transcript_9130/g.40089  ORF Transcript_9130/g.40089 Transcript_9130/m.40089 type:complete len:90 (-) Transcript_9130:1781-2050(-)